MEYINFKVFSQAPFHANPKMLVVFQAIKQNRTEDRGEDIEPLLKENELVDLETLGYVTFVKPKNKLDTKYDTVRLAPKGTKALELLHTIVGNNKDLQMAEHFCDMYMKKGESNASDEGVENKRSIGNRKNVLIYIAEFRARMGFTIYEMYWLCYMFVEEVEYTIILENVFFDKNKNRYGKFKDNIEDSKIYQFYMDKEEAVKEYWKKKIK